MDIQSQKQETVMTVLHLFMTLLQSYYQIKISRYSTTEKYYGNIWLIIMALKVFIVTSAIISGNILNSIHISEKEDHQIPIRLPQYNSLYQLLHYQHFCRHATQTFD